MKGLRVNLGCGGGPSKGFVNVDLFAEPKEGYDFRRADIRALPFDAGSVEYALMDNVLEHLALADVPTALYELRRVLRPKGRAVIIVPDFSAIARAWLQVENVTFTPYLYHYIAEEIYGNQWNEGEFHRTPMSPAYLNYVLRMTGFRKFTLTMFKAGGKMTQFPGMESQDGKVVRNDMIVADARK